MTFLNTHENEFLMHQAKWAGNLCLLKIAVAPSNHLFLSRSVIVPGKSIDVIKVKNLHNRRFYIFWFTYVVAQRSSYFCRHDWSISIKSKRKLIKTIKFPHITGKIIIILFQLNNGQQIEHFVLLQWKV